MICGECKERDVTVSHVRECSGAPVSAPEQPALGYGPKDRNSLIQGRYAIDFEDTLRFFEVNKPTHGKWSGFTFVKEQAGDALHEVRGNRARRIIAAIDKDPEYAMIRYGRELGICGVCGRTLTDEFSRSAGVGPVCRDNHINFFTF